MKAANYIQEYAFFNTVFVYVASIPFSISPSVFAIERSNSTKRNEQWNISKNNIQNEEEKNYVRMNWNIWMKESWFRIVGLRVGKWLRAPVVVHTKSVVYSLYRMNDCMVIPHMEVVSNNVDQYERRSTIYRRYNAFLVGEKGIFQMFTKSF